MSMIHCEWGYRKNSQGRVTWDNCCKRDDIAADVRLTNCETREEERTDFRILLASSNTCLFQNQPSSTSLFSPMRSFILFSQPNIFTIRSTFIARWIWVSAHIEGWSGRGLLSVTVWTRASVFFIRAVWTSCAIFATYPGTGRVRTITPIPTKALMHSTLSPFSQSQKGNERTSIPRPRTRRPHMQ